MDEQHQTLETNDKERLQKVSEQVIRNETKF
jgi:hypothetical protein